MKINLNDFAVKVAKIEGKKVEQNIGQIKETIKIVFEELSKMELVDILDTIGYRK